MRRAIIDGMYKIGEHPRRGAREKCDSNIRAIEIAKSDLPLTDADRDALASYCGWGDSDVRNIAFDWHGNPRPNLAGIVTPEEARAMGRSTLNAHYTEPSVARAIWQIAVDLLNVSRAGTQGGAGKHGNAQTRGATPSHGSADAPWILEPSCGSGIFFGTMPGADEAPAMWGRGHPNLVGVEMEPVTAQIAARLYPEARIICSPFEAAPVPAGFDLAIGNVPFADVPVHDPTLPAYLRRTLHDYFVCKVATLLRPGGILALVTSTGTLDKRGEHVRRWLAKRCALIGALRLPGDAFKASAGTSVTTDVLFMQRLSDGVRLPDDVNRADSARLSDGNKAPGMPDWLLPDWVVADDHTAEVPASWGDTATMTARLNGHYVAHPERMLGRLVKDRLAVGAGGGVRFGLESPSAPRGATVEPLSERMLAAARSFPRPLIFSPDGGERPDAPPARHDTNVVAADALVSDAATSAALAVYRAAKRVLSLESGDGDLRDTETARRRLNVSYDFYHRQWGRVSLVEHQKGHPLAHLLDDPRLAFLLALEDPAAPTGKALIFARRTLRGATRPTGALTPQDALYRCLDALGRVDLDWIAAHCDGSAEMHTAEETGR